MKSMKKKYKIIIGTSITIGIIGLSIISITQSVKRKKNAYSYLPITSSHYLLNKDNVLKFDVYSSHHQDEYLKKEKVNNSYIKDLQTKDYYEVTIKDIVEKEEKVKYENQFFYQYIIVVEFPIKQVQHMQVKDAKLILNFENDEKREFKVGTIILNDDEHMPFFSLTNLKGIVNEIEGVQTLKGVCFTLDKEFDETVSIIKIESLDKRITTQKEGFFLINDMNFDNEINIHTLEESAYCQGFVEYPIVVTDNRIKILMELNYDKIEMITIVGFKITYERKNRLYTQYIMPFQYFNSSSKEVNRIVYGTNSY